MLSLSNFTRTKRFEVPDYGQIGAGEVVDFIPRGKGYVQLPQSQFKTGLAKATVCGDSLIDLGINNGDELLCLTQFEKSSIQNGKLVIAELPIGLVVKFFYQFEHTIVLRSANRKYNDLIYEADLVTIKAIVLQSIKTW